MLYRGADAAGGDSPLFLKDIVQKILSPYALQDEGGARVALAGPEVRVGARAVTNLALVLHELSTNSAKYGALSVPEGRLAVTWAVDGQKLSLKWEESGGPPVAGPPTTHGFGTLLSSHSVRGDFSGSLNYDWREGGLVVDLDFQLNRLAY